MRKIIEFLSHNRKNVLPLYPLYFEALTENIVKIALKEPLLLFT